MERFGSYGLLWLGLAIVNRWQLRQVAFRWAVALCVTVRQLWRVRSRSVRFCWVVACFGSQGMFNQVSLCCVESGCGSHVKVMCVEVRQGLFKNFR